MERSTTNLSGRNMVLAGSGLRVGSLPARAVKSRKHTQTYSRSLTRMARQASPAQLAVKTLDGSQAGDATLNLRVADPEKAKGLVHRYILTILQNQRQGSANTKTRAEVAGGGRKPFAQKGTGNARQGSRTTPLKPGGGVIFGPKPKDWSIKMNKKERKLALATALQSAASAITVVDDIKGKLAGIKTKTLVDAIAGLGIDLNRHRVLLIVDEISKEIELSARNITNLALDESESLNAYNILRADHIVMDKASLTYVNDFFGQSSSA